MRAFIAVDLPPEFRTKLGQMQASFEEQLHLHPGHDGGLRWARPEGIHLTLKFLGDISQEQSSRAAELLRRLDPFEEFTVEIKGYGFFPDARRPQVFWAGVVAPPALAGLAGRIDRAMAPLGFRPETRPFAPHLTLARFKTRSPQPALEATSRELGARTLGQFEVSEFALFESQLALGSPAHYREIARFPERGVLPVL